MKVMNCPVSWIPCILIKNRAISKLKYSKFWSRKKVLNRLKHSLTPKITVLKYKFLISHDLKILNLALGLSNLFILQFNIKKVKNMKPLRLYIYLGFIEKQKLECIRVYMVHWVKILYRCIIIILHVCCIT